MFGKIFHGFENYLHGFITRTLMELNNQYSFCKTIGTKLIPSQPEIGMKIQMTRLSLYQSH